MVRALLYQPGGPGLIYGMCRLEAAITRGNLITVISDHAAAIYHANYMLENDNNKNLD
jgi:hypothetical protein